MSKRAIIFILRAFASLPLSMLYMLSGGAYFIIYYLLGYRKKVVGKNLREAFPEKSEKELKKIEKQFYHFLCDLIVETLKLLAISDEEMRERVKIEDHEQVNDSIGKGKTVVLLLGHYGNWEWVQEIRRCFTEGAKEFSIYHPLKSKLWDEIFKEIRGRWHVSLLPQFSSVRTLLASENRPWICGFIADHRPRMIEDNAKTPFLNHNTSFIYGPEVIGKKVGADFYYLEMERPKRGNYNIRFIKLEPDKEELPYPMTRSFWRYLEKSIRKNPAFWLWSHKRWKYDEVISQS